MAERRRALTDAGWRALIRDCPEWVLEAELASRREAAPPRTAIAIGEDFLCDPGAGRVVWRGVAYPLMGRQLEVVQALATLWLGRRPRPRAVTLAGSVWREFDRRDALQNLYATIGDLKRAVPGLIVSGGNHRTGYRLALEVDATARRVRPDAD